jgi:hypothetical protein
VGRAGWIDWCELAQDEVKTSRRQCVWGGGIPPPEGGGGGAGPRGEA